MRNYWLLSILLMKPGEKKGQAFSKFLMVHPPEKWGYGTYWIINRYLTCKSHVIFEARINGLSDLAQEAKLDNLRNIILGCRAFEERMLKHRKFDKEGRSVFGATDRVRILGDRLDETYGPFSSIKLAQ